MSLLPLLLFFAAMYFLMIRPQQRRIRQHQSLVASLRVGDEVVTAGGIFGTVTALDSEATQIEVSPGVTIRVMRGSISRRLNDDPAGYGDDEELAAGSMADIDDLDDELRQLEQRSGDPEPSPDPGPRPAPGSPDATGRRPDGNGHGSQQAGS